MLPVLEGVSSARIGRRVSDMAAQIKDHSSLLETFEGRPEHILLAKDSEFFL